jgi:hypothetical protein
MKKLALLLPCVALAWAQALGQETKIESERK